MPRYTREEAEKVAIVPRIDLRTLISSATAPIKIHGVRKGTFVDSDGNITLESDDNHGGPPNAIHIGSNDYLTF